MGLDIRIYKTKDWQAFKDVQAKEAQVEAVSEEVWKKEQGDRKYDDLTQEEKDTTYEKSKQAQCEKAKELGLELDPDKSYIDVINPHYEAVEERSKKHPEEDLFTLGYFRSSYNDGGINSVLRNTVGKDLYDIFPEASNEGYYVTPDWEQALKNAQEVLEEFKTSIDETGAVRVHDAYYNEYMGSFDQHEIKTKEDALKVYKEELERYNKNTAKDKFRHYSNGKGEFIMDEPLKVKAIIVGVQKRLLGRGHLPCTYIIYEDSNGLESYIQSLEVVIEAIEAVLADKEHTYFMGWSG